MECNSKRVLLLLAACAFIGQATGVLYDQGKDTVGSTSMEEWEKLDGNFTFAGRSITNMRRSTRRACLVLSGDNGAIDDATTLPAQNDQPAICPLFAEYSSSSSSSVKYQVFLRRGVSDNLDLAAEIEEDLNALMANFNTPAVKLTDLIMYTWVDISTVTCNDASCRNTFQMAIAIAGQSTYLVLNYEKINAAGFNSAPSLNSLAGINLGDFQGFEHLPFSNRSLDTIKRLTDYGTSEVKGRYFYRISTHRPQRLGCFDLSSLFQVAGEQPLTLSTYNMDIYGGHRLLVQGPCFNTVSDKISCAFSRRSSSGQATWEYTKLHTLDNYTGVCLSPRTPRIDLGWTTLAVSLTSDSTWHYKSPIYIAAPSHSEMPVQLKGDKANWLSVSPSASVSFTWTASTFGTVAIGTMVQYLIVGYKNVNGVVTAVEYPPFTVSGSPTTVLQTQTIDLKSIRCTANCENVAIGQIVIRLATGVSNTTATRYEISSPIIPIGWYTYYANDANQISKLCRDNLGQQQTPLSCPCNVRAVAAEKGKFIPAPDCGTDGKDCFFSDNTECYVTTPNHNAGLRCCYATTGGHLIYGQDAAKRGSYTTQYAPLTSSLQATDTSATVSYLLSHVVPYAACCVWPKDESKECHHYGIRHAVAADCAHYKVSGISAVVGDPHFITPDTSTVTFNSNGEFWFLKPLNAGSNQTRIQVRLTRNFGSGTRPVDATVLSAIVMAYEGSTFEIQMRTKSLQQTKKLHLYYNGKEVIFFDIREQVYGGLRVTSSGGDQSKIHVMSSNDGTSIQCEFETITGLSQMRCTVYIQSSMKNQTSGLIGNWNGIAGDDLAKQGSIDAFPLTNLTTVNEVGLTWALKTEESLFTYIYTTFDDNLPNFTPRLAYTVNEQLCPSPADAAKQACSYDLVVTNSTEFAQKTRGIIEEVTNQRNNLNDQRNTDYCPFLDIPGATKEFTSGYQANSEVTVTGCKTGYAFSGSRTKFTCGGGVWTPAPTALCSEVAEISDAGSDMLVIIIVCSVIGGLLLIGLIIGGIIYWKKRSKKDDDDEDEEDGNANEAVKMETMQGTQAKPPVYGQQVVYGQRPAVYGQQPAVYGGGQPKVYDGAQQKVYGEGQQKVYGEGQQKVYGEGQQKVYGDTQQKIYGEGQQKIYGPGQQGDNRQSYEYGQNAKQPASPDYGRTPPRNDYAPPVAPRQQPGYGGVRVLPVPLPGKAAEDTDSSESEEDSDDGQQRTTMNGSDDV